MVLVKVLKNRPYFKRYQTKPRRRREGKTDFKARRALVGQSKDKYGTPKRRLTVRVTCSKVICQIIHATYEGDCVLESAESTELVKYGIPCGLTNFAAAYATGLLLACRTLKKMNMDSDFKGVEKIDGAEFNQESINDRRPLKCHLDLGIVRARIGCRIFAAMKGCVDGGIHVPHSVKIFPGYNKENKSFDPTKLRARIFGTHIANFMKELKDTNPDRFKLQFSQFVKNSITPEKMESMYQKAHELIRANPDRVKKEKKAYTVKRVGHTIVTPKSTYKRPRKLTADERKERVAKKLQMLATAE